MPISVSCPSCSVAFKTKDEYAGKRAKCPKCGEPLTIPPAGPIDTVMMPAPVVAARPVVASKPKAAPTPVADDADDADEARKPKRRLNMDDDEEDKPAAPKRKRGADSDDEDEDEKPKRKRAESSDDDEDAPKRKRGEDDESPKGRRRRRDEDNDEPKKKSKLPLILGILGGLFLLCGGGCAGAYFFWLKPASDNLAALGSSRMTLFGEPSPTEPNDAGGGSKAASPSTNTLSTTTTPAGGGDKPGQAAVELPARDLFKLPQAQRRSYSGKLVQLSGPVQRVQRQSFPDNRPVTYGTIEVGPSRGKTVPCRFTGDNWTKMPEFDDLKEYVIVGMGKEENFELTLVDCRVVGEATPPPNDGSLTFANAAHIKAGMTLAQIEKMFGKGAAPTIDQVVTWLTELSNATEAKERWAANHKSGRTLIWKKRDQVWDQIVVAFSDDPNSGGVVVGVYGYIGLKTVELVKLPAVTGGGTVTLPGGDTAIEVTADELLGEYVKDSDAAEKKYLGKLVRVTGEVKVPSTNSIAFPQRMEAGFTFNLIALFAPEQQKQLTGLKGGEKVVLVGRVSKLFVNMKSKFKGVSLQESKLVN